MDMDDILLDAEDRMDKAVGVYADELRGIRAGTANPGLVESIRINYYGSQTPLKQVANIGIPDPQLLVIKPYDPSCIQDIVKSIQKSDIGINPQTDGKVIRLAIPGLSEERRNQLVDRIKDMAEDAKVAIRNIRRDANKKLEKLEKDSEIGEDDCRRSKDQIQKMTDNHNAEVEDLLEKKAVDITKV